LETEYLVDCHYLGINNVMALRGDAMKDSPLSQNGWKQPCYRFGQQIKLLNEGKYLHEVVHVDNKTDFCIGGGLS
jgi:methylenetetrahydrofolate reductase (NADPH)